MAIRIVVDNYVLVVGKIWLPPITCSMRYNLSSYDLKNIGEFTRDNVDRWLATHAGDFQSIQDFYATAGEVTLDWSTEDGELAYLDTGKRWGIERVPGRVR